MKDKPISRMTVSFVKHSIRERQCTERKTVGTACKSENRRCAAAGGSTASVLTGNSECPEPMLLLVYPR